MARHEYWKACRKVVCVGRNYTDHAKELGNQPPSRPFFFLKPPSSILPPSRSGSTEKPRLRISNGIEAHHEVELALVMGENLTYRSCLSLEDALDSVAGYALGIDMTARNVQAKAKAAGLPWTIAKGFDNFLPVSNFIRKECIPDPHNVGLWLKVEDKMRQDGSTSDMIFKIPELLQEITTVMTLEANDLILTGTPKGVGPVHSGERVTAGLTVDGEAVSESTIELVAEVNDIPYRL